jgi:uncharacterized protein (TIGR00297 family)
VSLPLLLAAGLVVNAAAAGAAFWKRAVDAGGAAAGIAVGTVVFGFGGPLAWLVLGAFFLSSTVLSRLGGPQKADLSAVQEKGDRRDFFQVVANGGAAAIAAVLYRVTRDPGFAVAFAVAFAASNADTWASEVGVLSRRQPVSILSMRPVARGLSGGVTLLGIAASLAGSLFIALVFTALQGAAARAAGGLPAPAGRVGLLPLAAIVSAAGFLGSVVDSLLGASLQAQYAVESGPGLTERPAEGGRRNRLVRGIALVTNDVVNLASTAAAAAGGLFLYRVFS